MLAEKIGNVSKALGALAHKVDEETWAVLRMAKNELADCYDIAVELENTVITDVKTDVITENAVYSLPVVRCAEQRGCCKHTKQEEAN